MLKQSPHPVFWKTRLKTLLAVGLGLCFFTCLGGLLLGSVGLLGAFGGLCSPWEGALLLALALGAGWVARRPRKTPPGTKGGCGCTASETAVACNLGVFSEQERRAHQDLGRRIFGVSYQLDEQPDGFDIYFKERSLLPKLELWTEQERRCCPFYRFNLAEEGDTILLSIRGPQGSKELFREGLQTLKNEIR